MGRSNWWAKQATWPISPLCLPVGGGEVFVWFASLAGEGLGEVGHGADDAVDVTLGGAAGEVGDRAIKTLENRADGSGAGELLHGFVEDVAGVEVGADEDVGAAGDGGVGGFFGADFEVDGGVELHFAVDEDVGGLFFNVCDGSAGDVDSGIFAAGAES